MDIPSVIVDPRLHCTKINDPDSLPFVHMSELFNTTFIEREVDLLQDIQLVVGLHPDEATEEIVDYGLNNNISFAVVPCCVFPDLFSDRYVNDTPVRTYPQFLEYLKQKDSSIKVDHLPIKGRNTVLYKIAQ
eukprot:TRINITY_DN10219_c0_g1_i1.p2 TRINITY_DN10219_c0_g1~~TRINITY_DN10219_c0_g1_i1.p2  ORF type:complete len:132 (-),score=17.29 TRINITY_DN10219_c0_g1_i1:14-409(-)